MGPEIKLSKDHILFFNPQGSKYKVVTDVWLCGPPEKDSSGKKFPGSFPAGFLKNLKQAFSSYYPLEPKTQVLHVCAGRVPKHEGMTLDIDPQYFPDFCCNAETMILPDGKRIQDERFHWTISDWPYNEKASKLYYRKKLLNKHEAFKQMNRVTQIGGFIGVLDEAMLAGTHKNLIVVALIGVRSVPNLDFRTFTVYKKLTPFDQSHRHSELNQKLENF